MQKHDRVAPAANGRNHRSFCSVEATASSRCMLPSSGAKMCIATGPSSEYPASSNTTALPTCDRPRPPYSTPTCGAASPSAARHLAAKFLGRAMRGLAPVSLQRNDLVADERTGALLQLQQLRGERKIHQN